MDVTSLCPLPVASIIWQPGRGRHSLTIFCKATYDLAPSVCTLSKTQEPLRDEDEYANGDARGSLYAPSDRLPYKPRADVLLVGHAYAPHGHSVPSLVTRLAVGTIDKSIEVTGDRSFTHEGHLRDPVRFSKMPLRYERAAAGPDNPLGVRMDTPNSYGANAVPNLLPPGFTLNGPSDFIPTVGFGPIASTWRSRTERLGALAGTWPGRDWMQRPLPEGLDPSYFNAAPRDQQAEALRNDERILLEHLHPTLPRLTTSLPGLRPQAFIELAGRAAQEIVLGCDTLWIDTDRAICTLTWRGHALLEHPSQMGRVLVVLAQAGQTMTWADVERLAQGRAIEDARSTPGGVALGFGAKGAVGDPKPQMFELEEDEMDERMSTVAADDHARFRAPLPFARAEAPPSRPGQPPPPAPRAAPPPPPASVPPAVVSASPVASSGPAVSPWAVRTPVVATPLPAPEPMPVPLTPLPKPAQPAPEPPKVAPREVLDLLWYEDESVRRMRAIKAWERALATSDDGDWIDGDAAWKTASEASDRTTVIRILTKIKPLSADELLVASAEAVDELGTFSPPLVVTTGELQPTFDEIETLKAYVTTTSPLASGDKRLKEAVDAAREALEFTWPPSPSLAESLTTRIKEAFAQGNRTVGPGHLDASAERALLAQRLFQKRTILGKPRLRCLFTTPQNATPIPVYLPESLATKLPMFQRFRATIVAEAHGQQDQYEAHPLTLLVVALGRLLPVAPRPPRS